MVIRRPNILFLMSDEHRFDVAGFAGNDMMRTPTLDLLAQDAVVFNNAYTPAPICVPARPCIAAGQLPHTCGCYTFNSDLPPQSMTFARQLARYGYTTSCHGKLHHQGVDQMQGWTQRGAGDMKVHDWANKGLIKEELEKYKARPGTGKWSNQKEIEQAGIGSAGHDQDERFTQSAVSAIYEHFADVQHDRPQGHRPLILKVSLTQPHYPFLTDQEKFTYYLNRVPIYTDQHRFDHPVLRRSQNMDRVDASPRDVRRATAAYYGMIEDIDTQYARVLNALRHVGEDLDDWIIIYTSDHGEMLGEYGIWEKAQFFEGSARVPLMIRWPRQFAPRVVEENVNLCDLFATLCDLTGIALPDKGETVHGRGLDSRSLAPLMNGDKGEWAKPDQNESISEFGGRHLMIKCGCLKYLWYGEDGPPVLFDLSSAAGETKNVIDDPAYSAQVARFTKRREALGY